MNRKDESEYGVPVFVTFAEKGTNSTADLPGGGDLIIRDGDEMKYTVFAKDCSHSRNRKNKKLLLNYVKNALEEDRLKIKAIVADVLDMAPDNLTALEILGKFNLLNKINER